ncbi:hypothetical protein [Polaribacter glomeratus]|uniref:Uncharacterized protein n=1 Tax=Polaribacter glomeratus TaxID=102 RepID=A0A2S7WGF0_9FLAO|nr:hypothetical protein [Polaribacter glomeratus]PQJ76496.1 hypothetical protein BTO16_11360 [Polaribacter glomeratus]TXD64207.1 hypothetical protein ESX12_15965 [Polaribacter glomeratus]
MRNLNLNRKTTRKPTSQISRLEAIHRLINGRTFQPELVEEKLFKINPSYLSPYCFVYYQYLNVRHHFNYFQSENIIEHLELASGLIDTMDVTAYKNDVKVRCDEYHFTRAYVKFIASKFSTDDYEGPYIKAKSQRIVTNALRFTPNSSKFIWLQQQLVA